jgi:hypothetical protein
MIKNKKRYCDRCRAEMPMIAPDDNNPHDIIKLGWKTRTGSVMNVTKDICTDCMDLVDELLSGEPITTE